MDGVGFEARSSCSERGNGGKVAPKAAGKVGDGVAERGQPRRPAAGDERVGHHLQAVQGVEEPGIGPKTLEGARAERELFGERRCHIRGELPAEAAREPHGIE